MKLFITRFFQNNLIQSQAVQNKQSYLGSLNFKGLEQDTFEKTISSSKARGGSHTKAGDCLKELDNVTCPYSGVKMISYAKMEKIEKKLRYTKSLPESLEVLKPYKPCMQKLEKQIYMMLKDYAVLNPRSTANQCLQSHYPEALAKLKIEELKVLDNIDKISNKVEPKTALQIRTITTNARKRIIDDNTDQIFKRKDILSELDNLMYNYKNPELAAEIREVANKLPKSSTNINAFIVKYAKRDRQEILSRLLRPSTASIEHITPKSINPDHTLSNFMLASRDWNSDRGSTSLPEYIKKHQNIPKYCQKYTNDIINSIHKKKLVETDWYPYMLKEKLYNESSGIINVSLSRYKLSEAQAFKNAPKELVEKYNLLKEENKKLDLIEL